MMNFLPILTHNYKPWGLLAISFVILAVLLGVLGIYVGRKLLKKELHFNLSILAIGLVLLAMEITHEVERYIEFGSYDWSSFPFQFCSVSIYLSFIVPLLKKGKVKNCFIMFFCMFTTLSGILPLIFAQGNLLRWPTVGGVIFSFVWHIILIFEGALSIGYLKVGTSFIDEYKYILSAFAIFVAITCVAELLNVAIHYLADGFEVAPGVIKEAGYMPNYELDPDSASLFYISPYFKSNIGVVFDSIWLNAGWVVCWIVYDIAFIFGASLVYALNFGIISIYREVKHKKNYMKL